MTHNLHLRLFKPSMSAPVVHAVNLRGTLTDEGVDVFFWSDGTQHLALVADRASNHGVSATNSFEEFAEALKRAVGERLSVRAMAGIQWFELDSMGMFDEALEREADFGFIPLVQPGHQPRCEAAFLARMKQLAPASELYWMDVVAQLEPARCSA